MITPHDPIPSDPFAAFEQMADVLLSSELFIHGDYSTVGSASDAQVEAEVRAQIAAWRAAILGTRRLTLLVTASRHLTARLLVQQTLWTFDRHKPQLVHGAARGGDTLAHECALDWGWPEPITYPLTDSDWAKHGLGAGQKRNRLMHDTHRPDLVIALRAEGKSNGTDGMVAHAKKCGTPVWLLHQQDFVAPPPPHPWQPSAPVQYTFPSG